MRLLVLAGVASLLGIGGANASVADDVRRCYEETGDLKLKVTLCTRAIDSGELGN